VADRPFIDWAWIAERPDDIAEKLVQHLTLLIIPMVAGFAISLVLAILALRRPGTVGPVTVVTGLLYTIPSLAAFAVLRPIFGLSLATAVIPLTTYTLLILYRNTVAGLRAVPPEIHEAALGMGYTPRTRLLRVELPLAVPLIMAGVRLAAVTTIGLVTVASVIGADKFGGFGQFITEGLQTNFTTKIYLGAVLSVVLAFVVDALLVMLERVLTPWARVRAARG
jgi:osmoprotectant transport system permease protein